MTSLQEDEYSNAALISQFERIVKDAKTHWKGDIDELRAEFTKSLATIKSRLSRPPGGGDSGLDVRESLGSRFLASPGLREWLPKHRGATPSSMTFKAVVGGLANIVTSPVIPTMLPGVVPLPVPPAGFANALAWRPITVGNQVDFLQQTSAPAPGAKTQVAEGDVKSEVSIGVALASEPILTIAAWTSASTQILQDVGMLQVFIDLVLTNAVRAEIDRQALIGIGSPTELKGITSLATPYNAAANVTGDTKIDAISHAIAQLAATGVAVDVVVLNPIDAEGLRLIKTTYGEYVLGDPAASGSTSSLWGVRVIQDANMTAGSFLVGSTRTAEILDREEATVGISLEHADYFVRNLAAIRCEARVGLGVYVPGAWCFGQFPAGSVMNTPLHAAPAAEHAHARR
jgi:hypothetical protein